jgi:lipopolysaccharide biosynthesis glycosyltransferase
MEKSYVSFMWNDRDLPGVLTNAHQLRKLGSKYPYSCLVTKDVSKEVQDTLTRLKINIIKVNFHEILQSIGFEKDKVEYIYNKIHFVCLFIFTSNIKKGIYIDADVLILKNLDHLFDTDTTNRIHLANDLTLRHSPNNGWMLVKLKNKYNAGVICFESNHRLFYDMMNYLKKVTEKEVKVIEKWTDQEVFNHFINNNLINVSVLDFKYNTWFNTIDFFVNKSKLINEDDIHIIHYILSPKPWTTLSVQRYGSKIEKKYWLMWFDAYKEVISNNFRDDHTYINHNELMEQ